MKRCATCVALVLPFLAADPAGAFQQSSTKIAVVNVAKVFDGYKMTKDLEARFDSERQRVSQEAESRRQSMENQLAGLRAFDPASRDFQERRADIMRSQIEYKVWLELEEVRLKDEHMVWLRKIYEDVRGRVAVVAKERSFDLVLTYDELSEDLPDSLSLRREILLKKVIYSNDRIDITQSVLTGLNQAYEQQGGTQSLSRTPPLPNAPKASVPKPAVTP